jgi:predicted NBD/HSP70 family sugar kinase
MIAGIDLGGTQVRVALARSDGRIRRGRLGDRAGQVGALEWARAHL